MCILSSFSPCSHIMLFYLYHLSTAFKWLSLNSSHSSRSMCALLLYFISSSFSQPKKLTSKPLIPTSQLYIRKNRAHQIKSEKILVPSSTLHVLDIVFQVFWVSCSTSDKEFCEPKEFSMKFKINNSVRFRELTWIFSPTVDRD